MSQKLKDLQEKRNKLAAEIRTQGEAFNSQEQKWKDDEQRQSWEKVNKDYNEVLSQLRDERAAIDVEKRLNELSDEEKRRITDPEVIPGREPNTGREDRQRRTGQPSEETRCLAMAAWCRSQLGLPMRKAEVRACREIRLNPNAKELRLKLPRTDQYRSLSSEFRQHHPSRAMEKTLQSRAMSAYTLGSGGILVPNSFVQTLEVNMLAYGGIRQAAELMVTGSGEEMKWPTADDTSNQGERLGESASIGNSVDPTFGAVTWGAYKYSSKAILVPYELLEDSVFDIPSMLGGMMGERIGRKTAVDYTTGSGASGPKGIVTAATLGKTATGSTALTADEIFDLVHSVDPAYRTGAGFMLHDNIVLYLRKLKDGEGRYLWQNGMSEGVPDRLVGYPLTISQEMASAMTTGQKVLLFGQLGKYKIRRVNAARMYRLEERYRDTDQDGFILIVREDGNLLTAGTAPVKYLQLA